MPDAALRESLEAAYRELDAAWASKDLSEYEEWLAPGFTYGQRDGSVDSREECLAAMRGHFASGGDLGSAPTEILHLSVDDDVLVARTRCEDVLQIDVWRMVSGKLELLATQEVTAG